MSYPDPVYLGESGETNATVRRIDGPPDFVSPAGTRVHYLATGATTRGRYGLYRWEMGPSPLPSDDLGGVPRAVGLHPDPTAGDGWTWSRRLRVRALEGGIHGFRNRSDEPATMLILFAPGAPREAYFEGGSGVASMSEGERDAFYLAHDNIWVPGADPEA
ncbi:MAG: cupin [Chloroflexota bacterium]